MKIAVISDIHGNLTALESVLPEIEDADKIVCLGDVALVGPQPRGVVTLLRKMKWPCVLGNTDETLAKSRVEDYSHMQVPQAERRRMMDLDRWTRTELDDSDKKFLSRFRPTIRFEEGDFSLLCYHGSPRSNTEGILPTTSEEQLTDIFAGRKATIFAGGHTHSQMIRKFGASIIINPGSIGLPYFTDGAGKAKNPCWAEFAMLTTSKGNVAVEVRRVRYNLGELKEAVQRCGMPDPDWWLADWL